MQKLKVFNTAKRKGLMAKITIVDRTDKKEGVEKIMPSEIREMIHKSIIAALDRLGNATDIIEVIIASPMTVEPTVKSVGIKIVINSVGGGHPSGRTEQEFWVFCNDNLHDFLQQRLIEHFITAVTLRTGALIEQTENLSKILLGLEQREKESGNENRCKTCCRIRDADDQSPSHKCRNCFPNLPSSL